MTFSYYHHSRTSEEGSLLLVALVILGAITLSTIFLSLVLLQEIRSTRFADNGVVSYYAAESGAERALWRLQRSRSVDAVFLLTELNTVGSDQCAAEDDGGSTGDLCISRCDDATRDSCADSSDCTGGVTCVQAPVGAGDPERLYTYTTVSTSAGGFEAFDIPRNRPVHVDLMKPELPTVGANIDRLMIDWYVGQCTGVEGSAKLEITYTPINPADFTETLIPRTFIDICGCQNVGVAPFKCDPNSNPPYSKEITDLNPNMIYRATMRSLDVDLERLTLLTGIKLSDGFYDGICVGGTNDGEVCDKDDDCNSGACSALPSQIEIGVTGIYRESESAMSVRASWQSSVSGIFNFVLFSQDSLIKDVRSSNGAAYSSLCAVCTDTVTACSTDDDCKFTCDVVSHLCSNGEPGNCDDNADCTFTCSTPQSAPFCALDNVNGESNGTVGSVSQTNANACNSLCNGLTYCGDGTVQNPNGALDGGLFTGPGGPFGTDAGVEECDLGAGNSDILPNTCRTYCLNPFCGDSVRDTLEECDDGLDSDNTDECDTENATGDGECKLTYCGDDIIQDLNGESITEQCDDGNISSGDGCDSGCQVE